MDSILFWNDVSLEAVARDHTGMPPELAQGGPTRTSRALAIVHLAMYDAFNSIAKLFTPYLSDLPVPPDSASQDAAIGEAAYVTLINLYPNQVDRILQSYHAFLDGLSDTPEAIEEGRVQGRSVAKAMLIDRLDDGSVEDLPYTPGNVPGQHRPDPLNPNQGFLTPNWGQVKPFAIENFLADEPPALDSARYAQDFNDVKEKGRLSGGTRTPEETTIGLFWAYDGAQQLGTPPRFYNQIIRVIAIDNNNTLAQNARLFALVNMAMADAGIQCWYSKYSYNLWRPVLGIREADPGWGPTGQGDGNPETERLALISLVRKVSPPISPPIRLDMRPLALLRWIWCVCSTTQMILHLISSPMNSTAKVLMSMVLSGQNISVILNDCQMPFWRTPGVGCIWAYIGNLTLMQV